MIIGLAEGGYCYSVQVIWQVDDVVVYCHYRYWKSLSSRALILVLDDTHLTSLPKTELSW